MYDGLGKLGLTQSIMTNIQACVVYMCVCDPERYQKQQQQLAKGEKKEEFYFKS
jgi:hypothetical protein